MLCHFCSCEVVVPIEGQKYEIKNGGGSEYLIKQIDKIKQILKHCLGLPCHFSTNVNLLRSENWKK